ncbi:hypothetical protein K438DRAFT_1820056 [Mycena galopus ATCC 62051]|nr:hypothetical protein K438DRAFT_1820056 [Mycena galopus ATCC 62051]
MHPCMCVCSLRCFFPQFSVVRITRLGSSGALLCSWFSASGVVIVASERASPSAFRVPSFLLSFFLSGAERKATLRCAVHSVGIRHTSSAGDPSLHVFSGFAFPCLFLFPLSLPLCPRHLHPRLPYLSLSALAPPIVFHVSPPRVTSPALCTCVVRVVSSGVVHAYARVPTTYLLRCACVCVRHLHPCPCPIAPLGLVVRACVRGIRRPLDRRKKADQ